MIAIIGCGTLGSRVAELLADEELLLVDHDSVRPRNLPAQRFSHADIGRRKAEALAERLAHAHAHATFLDRTNLDLLSEAEVVCDCTDNLLTRRLLSRWCVQNGVALVHGAAGRTHGVAALFTRSPCLECLYAGKVPVGTCRSGEIDARVADGVARRQAALAREALSGRARYALFLVFADGERDVRMHERECASCRGTPEALVEGFHITFCTQAGCMSAKPLRRVTLRPRTVRDGNVTAHVHENGEIHFSGEEDADVLAQVAARLYAS